MDRLNTESQASQNLVAEAYFYSEYDLEVLHPRLPFTMHVEIQQAASTETGDLPQPFMRLVGTVYFCRA